MVAAVCCGYVCGVTIHDVCDGSLRRCYTGQLATSVFRATMLREKSNTLASF